MSANKPNNKPKVKLTNIVNRWATIKYNDVGRRDVIICEQPRNRTDSIKVYEPHEGLSTISADQIIEVRKYVNAQ